MSNYDALIDEQRKLNAEDSSSDLGVDEIDAPENLNAMISWHVRRILARCGGNVSRAAIKLGVARNTVRKYLCAGNEHLDGQRYAT